tara:strand:+ start:490 stop:663 length:174 start_codon:yes stop_codon:yes gene_type:complete
MKTTKKTLTPENQLYFFKGKICVSYNDVIKFNGWHFMELLEMRKYNNLHGTKHKETI